MLRQAISARIERLRRSMGLPRACWEEGIAIASVALMAGALVLLTFLIAAGAVSAYEEGNNDRKWERAFFVAEAGMDDFLNDVMTGGYYTEVEADMDVNDKQAVVAAADELVKGDPDLLVDAPEGQGLVFKREGESVAYAIGFTPSWDSERRTERVTKLEYIAHDFIGLPGPWDAEFALLSGGDIEVDGGALITNPGANVHSNGALEASYSSIEGCGTEVVPSGYDPGLGCPASPVPVVPVPLVDPLAAYHLSWFDMCPDSKAHYGPAYPDPTKANITGTPCGGAVVSGADGGKQGMTPTSSGWKNNDKNTPAGVYFVVGDFDGRIGHNNDVEVTIITTKPGYSLDCHVASGDVWIDAQSSSVGHPSAGGLTIVAAGDVVWRGGADFTGLVIAHEQIDFKGNSSVTGAVVSESACDTSGSPVSETEMAGTADLQFVGPITTPFIPVLRNPYGPAAIDLIRQSEL